MRKWSLPAFSRVQFKALPRRYCLVASLSGRSTPASLVAAQSEWSVAIMSAPTNAGTSSKPFTSAMSRYSYPLRVGVAVCEAAQYHRLLSLSTAVKRPPTGDTVHHPELLAGLTLANAPLSVIKLGLVTPPPHCHNDPSLARATVCP